ncbi:proteasome inhibitor PI31 subunit-like [Corticium candelabrum]|uniref:proteasome inhibitor PI31 subunit-like n=1 Tax=Corticium candelabrum TaxID=121492 RepID=UPI002E26D190|nr:proteasome inhibitor PI31 subunit-like [Corticium candelabrum]
MSGSRWRSTATATRAEDVVVLLIDRVLDGYNFVLLGSGETGRDDESGLETFPDDWNASSDVYSLRYRHPTSSKKFLLKIVRLDDQLLLHLLEVGSDQIETATVTTTDFVCSEDYSNMERCTKNRNEMTEIIKKELLANILTSSSESSKSCSQSEKRQTQSRLEDDPLRIAPHHHRSQFVNPYRDGLLDPSPRGFGDADRMPFHSGSGGMVMDPFRAGGGMGGRMPDYHDPRLPRGAVPPGARFDPFGPPGFGPGLHSYGPSRPDHDHMKPPGFDDMYM